MHIRMISIYEDTIEFELIEPEVFKRADVITKSFLNIVTILGLARTGKSTLMNSISEKEVFETSDEIKGCTKGAWISNTVQEIDGVENAGVAIFVDTEGQGNESKKSDHELLMPVLLLSKVIILNIKGRIAVTDVLEELALLVKVGDKIKAKRGKAKFGHLIIAVRDYDLKNSAEELHDLFFKDELGNSENINMRNRIRKQISERFGQPTVILFPNKKDVNKASDFQEKVEELKQTIHENIASPHYFHDNKYVTPKNVNNFMKEMLAHSKGGCLYLDSILESMEKRQIDEACSLFEKDILKQYDNITLPMSRGELHNKLTAIKDELLAKIKKETSDVTFKREECDKAIEELKNFSEERIVVKKNENERCKREAKERSFGDVVVEVAAISGNTVVEVACAAGHTVVGVARAAGNTVVGVLRPACHNSDRDFSVHKEA